MITETIVKQWEKSKQFLLIDICWTPLPPPRTRRVRTCLYLIGRLGSILQFFLGRIRNGGRLRHGFCDDGYSQANKMRISKDHVRWAQRSCRVASRPRQIQSIWLCCCCAEPLWTHKCSAFPPKNFYEANLRAEATARLLLCVWRPFLCFPAHCAVSEFKNLLILQTV